MLALNAALQWHTEATTVWLQDQSVNNEAWLILWNWIFKYHEEVLLMAASVVTRWDELHSQFPCNKVGLCFNFILISAPDFPPPRYSSHIAFSARLPFHCLCIYVTYCSTMSSSFYSRQYPCRCANATVVNQYFLQLLIFCFFSP